MREVFVLESLLKKYDFTGSLASRKRNILALSVLSLALLRAIVHGDPEEKEKHISISYRWVQRMILGELSVSTISRWLVDPLMRRYFEKVENGYSIWDTAVKLPVFRIMDETPIYNPVVVAIDLDRIQPDGVIYRGKRYSSAKYLTDLYFEGKKKSMKEYWDKYREIKSECKPTDFLKDVTSRKLDLKAYYAVEVARNGKKIEIQHDVCLNKEAIREAVKERKNLRVLDTTTDDNGRTTLKYYRSDYGRYYLSGNPLQFTPSKLREKILSDYFELDMSCASFGVLRETGRRLGISTDDYPEFAKFLKDPKAYRRRKYEEFRMRDESLSEDYIKTILNAIAYGGVLNEKLTLADVLNNTKTTFLTKTEGYSDRYIPLDVSSDKELIRLQREIRSYAKRIMSLCQDDVFLTNAAGLRIYRKGSTFGQKVAHLYQGMESEILKEIMNFPLPDGTRIRDVDDSIGLLLHDGIYINKKLWNIVNPEAVSLYLLRKGYMVSFTRK